MTEVLETRQINQLPQAVTVPDEAMVPVQTPDGPAVRVPAAALFGKYLSVAVSYPTSAELLADLDHAANAIALVFADADPANSAYWVKSGAPGAGAWVRTNIGKGSKGDPGSNAGAIGTFAEAAAAEIIDGIDLVTITGTLVAGDTGAGLQYVVDPAVDAAYVAAHPTTSFIEVGGRGFRLAGFRQAGSNPVNRPVPEKLQEVVSPLDFGAVPDGVTDNAVALQRALDTGRHVLLHIDLTYAFGQQLVVPDGGGFVGGGTLHMLTGAGKFDASAYSGAYATNQIGVIAHGKVSPRIEAKFTMEAQAGIRVCSPVSIRSSINAVVSGEASGFKEAEFPLLNWDSNLGGKVDWYAHDCTPNTDSLPKMQLTAFGVDYNRVGGVNTKATQFNVIAKNLRLGPVARAAYGEQSDAVNIQSQGYSGLTGHVYGEDVGEVLDCFGDGNIIDVVAFKAWAYAVKLIHGASNNKVRATVDFCMLNAVVYGGSNSAGKEVANNEVEVTAAHVGELSAAIITANTTLNNNTIVVTNVAGVPLAVGQRVRGPGIPPGAAIGTGSGGPGNYTLVLPGPVPALATATANGVTLRMTPGVTAAVATDGSSADWKPQRNKTKVLANGDGVNMDFISYEVSGNDNVCDADGAGYARAHSFVESSAGTGNQFRRKRNAHVRATIQTATTVSNGAVVLFDNQVKDVTNEFDPNTGIFTAQSDQRIWIMAHVRAPSIPAGKDLGLGIFLAGNEVNRGVTINYDPVSAKEVYVPVQAVLDVKAGQQVAVKCITSIVGNVTVTNAPQFSYLYIEQM